MNKLIASVVVALSLVGSTYASDSTKVDFNKQRPTTAVNLKINQDRAILLKGVMDEYSVGDVNAKIKELSETSGDIFLIINSPGGSVVDGFELINNIKSIKSQRKVNTICVVESEAYSMAALTAMFCHKTYMHRHANIMFHEASYGVQGSASQIASRVAFFNTYLGGLNKDVAAQMGIDQGMYEALIAHEFWLTADQATQIGVVDGVIDELLYTVKPKEKSILDEILGSDKDFEYDVVPNPLKDKSSGQGKSDGNSKTN